LRICRKKASAWQNLNYQISRARSKLYRAEDIVTSANDPLKEAVFEGRNRNDLGVISVREGLYLRNHDGAPDHEALVFAETGLWRIETSYNGLRSILLNRQSELAERGWEPSVKAHLCGTMNTWLRATQTAQLLRGDISLYKKADQAAIDAQWMLGRGRPDEPGAWIYGQEGDNGYWSTQTAFLGMRAEIINGGSVHFLKAMKWGIIRGVPEFSRRVVTDSENRKQTILTAGRLTLESTTRKRAIEAVLDHQRF